MKSFELICCCLLALLAVSTAFKSYAGYQVLRTTPLKDVKDLEKLKPLMSNIAYDFWSTPRVGHAVDIMTSAENVPVLWGELILLSLQPSVLVPDVGVTVEKERDVIEQMRTNEKLQGRAPALDRYLDFNEIQAYLAEVVATYPTIASIINIGSSYGNRPMNVLKLSNGPGKTGIFFDAAIHAREWLGPPTLLYSINELTENLAANQAMLDANDFYFLPVANPDGYDWTWTDDRMWRKTRKPNPGSACIGTDGNRNYDYHWGGIQIRLL
ncbi:hypothetical protein B566_EDAN016620 [Ephemera danica]|nr:hypothetical protein B566_EDAN016620 [Ephemera danica]